MSRLCIAMLSIAVLAGCGDSGQPLAPTPAAPPAARASAETATTISYVPTSATAFVPCANGGAGEIVELSGTLHRVTHVTETGNGTVHIKLHENLQDVSGTGLTTGDTYRGAGSFNGEVTLGPGQVRTIENQFLLIGPGPDNNFTVRSLRHLTVNANGEVTVQTVVTSMECS